MNSEWGTKHTCNKCAARFYDLNRAPVICPQCGTQQVIKSSPKPRALKKAPPPAPRNRGPKANDEAEQAIKADVTNDNKDEDEDDGGGEEEIGDEEKEDIDTDSKDDELLEDTSDLVEDADDMAEVMDNREEPAKD